MSESVVPGASLGPYVILGRLGAGGMGEVLLARDLRLDRRVAIKVLPSEAAADPERVLRFEREAKALAALNHPNIVTIFSVEETGGLHFYTMELVEGTTLAALVPPAGMPLPRLLSLAIPLVAALEAAHSHGITHRDLKPANVMVTQDGVVKLLDFGLAKLGGASPTGLEETEAVPGTRVGQVMGTYPYMSPEQVEGRSVDTRSDVFSLGVLLYEMATGRRPFAGESAATVIAGILCGEPPAPRSVNPAVPERLNSLILGCLRKDVDARVQPVGEVRRELEQLAGESQAAASPPDKRPSIVVLPFANMSADPEQEYFCDGLAEEIINALTRVEGVRVVARTSAFAFKGKLEDVREVGRKLGVGTVLEGSVRRAGDRLRITAQLIDVENGFHHWSERFDRTLADVFAIQDEISLAIVEKLRVQLNGGERSRLTHRATQDKEAHEALLKGRFFFYRRRPGDLELALQQYRLASSRDPRFATPHVCMAEVFSALGIWGLLPPREAFGQARAAAQRALELDDTLAEAHLEMGFVLLVHDWDLAGAEQRFSRVRDLGLDSPIAHAWYSYYLYVAGHPEEVPRQAALACELDPLNPTVLTAAAAGLLGAGYVDEAAKLLERAIELAPDLGSAHVWLGRCRFLRHDYDGAVALLTGPASAGLDVAIAMMVEAHVRAGRLEEAHAARRRLEELAASRYVQNMVRAMAAAVVGDRESARALIERAIADHEPGIAIMGRAVRSQELEEIAEPLLEKYHVFRDATGKRITGR